MKHSKHYLASAFVLGLGLLGVSPLWAADFYWTNNTANGVFNNAGNWFTNGAPANAVPGATDNTYFTNPAGPTINWTASATNANAVFDRISALNTTLTNVAWLLTDS